MRSTTPQATDAIAVSTAVKMTARITAYKSRVFFKEEDLIADHPLDAVGALSPNPVSEAIGYNSQIEKWLYAYVNEDGVLLVGVRGDEGGIAILDPDVEEGDPYIKASPLSKVSVYENHVVYFDTNLNTWANIEFDPELVDAGDEECLASKTTYDADMQGAAHLVSNYEFILVYIDNGATAFAIVSLGDEDATELIFCPSRLFQPSVLKDETNEADLYSLFYSAGVSVNNKIHIYITNYNGEVRTISYKNGSWSDLRVAIPSDLSDFKVGNAFTHDGAIFLCGMFSRKEEFVSDTRYTIFTKSLDGLTFSLDRRTLVSMAPFRFLAGYADGKISFFASNRYIEETAPYQVIGEQTDSVLLISKNVSGSAGSGWNVIVKSGAEEYYQHPLVKEASFSKLEIGVHTSSGVEWLKYHDVVIASVDKEIRDGFRGMTMQIVTDGKWHTSVMTHPFYMEMVGKSGKYDDTLSFSNLYKLNDESGVEWSFSVDFWGSEEAGKAFTPRSHAASTTTDHMTGDLKELLFKTYPVFGDEENYDIHIYGWSRAGKPDTNPNTPDPTTKTGPNDIFRAILEVEDTAGNLSTIVTTSGQLQSDHANPEQTYFTEGARAGSYPVVYSIPNPGEGWKLKRVGIRVISSSVETVYNLERVDIPMLVGQYPVSTSVDAPSFVLNENTAAWPLVETLILQVDENNADNGNEVSTSVALKQGYCYAIAVQGNSSFIRDGVIYEQDSEFMSQKNGVSWLPKESYPSVRVASSDFPYYSTSKTTKFGVQTTRSTSSSHTYVFKHDDARLKSSTISNKKIPYVYYHSGTIDVSLFLAGSGAISDISGGEFKVYIFESPVPFSKFRFAYGSMGLGGGEFSVVDSNGIDGFSVSSPTSIEAYGSFSGTSINYGHSIRISNTSGNTINVNTALIANPSAWGSAYKTVRFIWRNRNSSLEIIGEKITIYDIGEVEEEHSLSIENGAYLDLTITYLVSGGGANTLTETSTFLVEIAESTSPVDPKVPAPPSFRLVIPQGETIGDTAISNVLESRQKGIPQVLFATKPYSAFNFEIVGRFSIKGPWTYAGLIGLAEDEKNYTVGFYRGSRLGIAIVRDGKRTIVHEQDISMFIDDDRVHDIRFWHRDGLMGVDLKATHVPEWNVRGGLAQSITHSWGTQYGPIATNDDIFHVGVWGLIDPPKFRTTGFVSSSTIVPVLPSDINPYTGESDFDPLFSDVTGNQIDIEGVIYDFTGKNRFFTDAEKPFMGPYQIRNTESWDSPFNSDRNGKTYQGGKAIEITQFAWLNGTSFAELLKDAIIGSSAGYAWEIDETQWKVWITTGGQVVWLRNRARHYAADAPDYYADGADRVYITDALTGVTPVGDDVDYYHPWGTFVYRHSDDRLALHGFAAFSAEHDQSVQTLLSVFAHLSGTSAEFIGDVKIPSLELVEDTEVKIE